MSVVEIVLLGCLGMALLIQVYYLLFELNFSVPPPKSGKLHPVSVVICARNELKNLRQYLPTVLEQDYPDYQVVVVNDCSWDESGKYLEEMEDAFPRLKVVTIREQEKYQHGKKFALTLGIKGALHEHLVFTDADCRPAGKDWLRKMACGFSEGKEIVIGYGAYEKEPGLLNKWIRFDTVVNALMYLGRAGKGKAYMGVGRNMAYTKSLFFRNKGFANHYHLMSGDDDLFINETATSGNTSLVVDPEGFTYSKGKQSLFTWIWQKKRHMSTGSYYRSRDRWLVGFFYFTLFLFWIVIPLAFVLKLKWQLIVGTIATRLVIQMIIYYKGFKRLGESDLLVFAPFMDLFAAMIYPLLAVSNLFIKTKSWK
jgi:cellulose synthase/poly-beta-1,6-N-acetylglucosamine synthase-like glycosyltransferase